LLDNSFPGFVRSLAAGVAGELWLTTIAGDVVQYFPDGRPFSMLARKLKNPYGVARLADGAVAVAEAGTGKLLRVDNAGQVATIAEGLAQPGEVVAASNGTILVSEVGKGQITQVDASGKTAVLVSGLGKPQGLALRQNALLVLDRGAKQLCTVDLATKKPQVIAQQLPVGDPPGCSRGPMEFSGGLAVGADGTIYIAGDGEGSVLTVKQSAAS
jgi:glucose/arabinose dehydrogenase